MDFPGPHDNDAWDEVIAQMNANMEQMALALDALPVNEQGVKPLDAVETTTLAGVTVHIARPASLPKERERYAYLALHGGAMVFGEGLVAKVAAVTGAMESQCTTYSIDYRVPPQHRYPAGLDDVVTVYRELLKDYPASNIIISGVSGGGNLAAAATLKIRDIGLDMPVALVLRTPELDLTESGDTFNTLMGIDLFISQSLTPLSELYAIGQDFTDPYLSPLFADFSKGYPPTYIQAGTRDVFLSNAVRMHRKLLNAQIHAELHIWDAMPHGQFSGFSPEEIEINASINQFINKYFKN